MSYIDLKVWSNRNKDGLWFYGIMMAVTLIGIGAVIWLGKEHRKQLEINWKVAYSVGAESKCLGVPATSNPYRNNLTMENEWIKGWAEAECVDGKVITEE